MPTDAELLAAVGRRIKETALCEREHSDAPVDLLLLRAALLRAIVRSDPNAPGLLGAVVGTFDERQMIALCVDVAALALLVAAGIEVPDKVQ